jgi:hypothetical protein
MDYAKIYSEMHKRPGAFRGYSIKHCIHEIALLVEQTESKSLLDYGCGKGHQYFKRRVHDQWGGIMPRLYDPGVRMFSRKPRGTYDGVFCVDVMEHIEIEDIERIVQDISRYADRFVFYHIACRPSKRKRLPDGRDVHVTIRPPDWWYATIHAFTSKELEIGMKFDTRKM